MSGRLRQSPRQITALQIGLFCPPQIAGTFPYWYTAASWPGEDRKARTSFAAHLALSRRGSKDLLRTGMDEHAARMAARSAVDKKLLDVLVLMLEGLRDQDDAPPWSLPDHHAGRRPGCGGREH